MVIGMVEEVGTGADVVRGRDVQFLVGLDRLFLKATFVPRVRFGRLYVSTGVIITPGVRVPGLAGTTSLRRSMFSTFSVVRQETSMASKPAVNYD